MRCDACFRRVGPTDRAHVHEQYRSADLEWICPACHDVAGAAVRRLAMRRDISVTEGVYVLTARGALLRIRRSWGTRWRMLRAAWRAGAIGSTWPDWV